MDCGSKCQKQSSNDRFDDSLLLLLFSSETHFTCLVGQIYKKASAMDNREPLKERKSPMNLGLSVYPSVCLEVFLKLVHYFFVKLSTMLGAHVALFDRGRFSRNNRDKNHKKWSKMSQEWGLESFS